MIKKSYLVVIISFGLSILALLNTFGDFKHTGSIDIFYCLFALLGIIGSVLGAFGKVYSKWFLYVFYLLQTIFLYAGNYSFILNPGVAFPIKILSGTAQEALVRPEGIGINVLAIIMLFSVFAFIRPKKTKNIV